MGYILTNKQNNYKSTSLKEDILKLRGIKDPKDYLNVNKNAIISYDKLNDMEKGVNCTLQHIENNDDIFIQTDNDVDGICSAVKLYDYLRKTCKNNIYYSIGEGKSHGINAKEVLEQYSNVKLVFIPDAGSNQYKEHKILKNNNIDVICLDHHKVEKISKDAIVINNQISEKYSNKQFCGAGIVYKFLQALDVALWQNYADDNLDLLALALISDMMDIRSFETKYYINIGLRNIKNLMFKELLLKQGYSIQYDITPHNIAFYVTPLINAYIRYSNRKEKIQLFETFAGINVDKEYTYKSRKKDENGEYIIKQENAYEYMARKCSNAHAKQYREKTKMRKVIIEDINRLQINKNKIIVYNVTNLLNPAIIGLMANDIAQYYNKPCLLLRKFNEEDYNGSGRNIENVDLINLQKFLLDINLFNFVEGHENAHGVSINKNNINKLIQVANKKLIDVNFFKGLDFCIPFEELTDDFIETIDSMNVLWGQNLKEPLVKITNVYVSIDNVHLVGKNKNTISFESEDIKFIKFKSNTEEYENLIGGWDNTENIITLDIIGTCQINRYNNQEKLQIQIEDYKKLNN